MSVYDDHSWDRLTEIRRKTLEENGGQLQGSWGIIKDKDGSKLYEGFLWHNRPYGPGAEYYKNGKVFREGIWDIKGIVAGREYYENGQLRFEGIWRIHLAYGPNPPVYGSFFGKDGQLLYSGEFRIRHGGVGYPSVVTPAEYGNIVLSRVGVLGFDDFKK